MFLSLSLCYDLFILVLSLLAFSALASVFQLFTRNLCLQFQDRGYVILGEIDFRLNFADRFLAYPLPALWRVRTELSSAVFVLAVNTANQIFTYQQIFEKSWEYAKHLRLLCQSRKSINMTESTQKSVKFCRNMG